MKDKGSVTSLGTPNDPSPGVCYAPVENGKPNKAKKEHIMEGVDPPKGWKQVQCTTDCYSKK